MKKLLSLLFVVLVTFNATAQVSQTVNVTTPGTLATLASAYSSTVTNLTVTGNIDARDVATMRDAMPLLETIDLSGAIIKNYTGYSGTEYMGNSYPINQMPRYSFYKYDMPSNTYTSKINLKSIIFPNTLTSIGDNAFQGCIGLTSITIPASVTSIGSSFIGCSSLTGFVVDNANLTYASTDGFLLNKAKTSLISCPQGKGVVLTIPDGVTTIGASSFSRFTNLTSISFPAGVTAIGASAFQSCTGLTSITIPVSVTSIGSYAFQNCSGIKIINSLNTTPPTINSYAFENVSSIVYVPESALANYKAAMGWSTLPISGPIFVSSNSISSYSYAPGATKSDQKSFTVSGGMLTDNVVITSPTNFEMSTTSGTAFVAAESITLSQVSGLLALDTIYVRLKTGLSLNTYTGNIEVTSTGQTSQTIALTAIVRNLPETINVTTVGTLGSLFSASEMAAITKLTVTGSIDARDFKFMRDNLIALSDLDLSAVSIQAYTGTEGSYYDYMMVENTTYPANEMPQNSFCATTYGYTSNGNWGQIYAGKITLNNIILPTSLTSIGASALNSCTGLTSITIPVSVTSIGSSAFSGCTGLKITSLATAPPSGTLSTNGIANAVVYVPIGKADVYKTAWGTGTNVLIIEQDIDVTVNVTEVGKLATTIFAQTSIHPSLVTKLTVTGVLGASDITYIRDNMKQCYVVNIEGVNLTDLPADAFNGRSFLFTVKLPTNLKTIGDGAFNGCSNIRTMDFPATLTSIGSSGFNGCSSLTVIDAPASLNSVGEKAFNECSNLTDVTFNGNVTINVYYNGTFINCKKLKNITFKGAATIGNSDWGYGAFAECSNLTSVIFNSTASIGRFSFYNCTGLKTLSISGSNSIGSSSFQYCSGLTNISIPGATSIGSSAFDGCSNLTTIDIPASVTSIGDAAFQSCSKMDSVSIGAKVASIGANAFNGCSKLSRITTYRLTPATLGLNVFGSVNTQTCKLRILDSADESAYFSAAQWGSFLNVERINLTGKMGDSNEDGAINIVDVVNVVNYILEKPVVKFNLMYSDINKDGNINVIDVVQLVKQISSAAPAPAFRVKADELGNTAYWNVEQGIFSTYMPGGLRGFDITYTGSISNLPALEGFAVSAYTKNGVQHLLGYSMDNVIANQEFTQLFRLNESATINEMTFVNDNGSQVVMVKGTSTDLKNIAVKGSVVIENGQLRWTSADELLSLALYNSNGSLVSSSVNSTLVIPANAKGVYVLQVKTKGGNVSRKIVM